MKRHYVFAAFIVILTVYIAGTPAFGAVLSYAPTSVSTTLAGGTSTTVPVTIGIEQNEDKLLYFVWIQNTVTGSLPASWLGISPATAFLSPSTSQVNANITITVPADTTPGTYSAALLSKAMSGHHFADTGTGIILEVKVPAGCSGVPLIKNMDLDPVELWPPDHSLTEVKVSGNFELPEGCAAVNAGYSVEDEYGAFTGTGTAPVGPGQEFEFIVPVEAWRDGQDKDGRVYRIRVFIEDEAGIGSTEEFTVLVPHDQRKKQVL